VTDDVTVVVVARDAASTLHTALAGIAGQSSPPAGVVLVDDGSKDDTLKVAEAWADLLPLRTERLQENAGVGTARARALSLVRTPFVATLDADDYWLTDHLSALRAAAGPGRLVFARDLLWSPTAWVRAHARDLPPSGEQLRALVRGNLSSAGVMFDLTDYARVGGYRQGLRAGEDWDLYLRMVRAGVELVLAPEPTLLYRIASNSTSAGYRTAGSDVVVLEHALTESSGPDERGWIERELRRRRGRHSLALALEAAAAGRTADARRHAREALRGGGTKTRAIAGAILASPRLGSRVRAGVSERRWGP
jgi:succinoglycan biosynthesis protein ExoU